MPRRKSTGNRKALWLTGAAIVWAVATSASLTQLTAHFLGNDPALGHPIIGPLYQPFGWITWQWADWAPNWHHLFRTIDTIVVTVGLAATWVVVSVADVRRPHKYKDVHGTAAFLTPQQVMASDYIGNDNGVYIGAFERHGTVHYLRHDGAEHIAVIAPTRSGKGVGPVLTTLLSWLHSTVIMDEKGELWELTAGWRKQAGSHVIRWQPGHPTASAAFNFLEEVRIGTPNEVADAQNVAVMLIDPEGKGFKDHWDRTSFALLSGVVLHTMYCFQAKGRVASLPDVAATLASPDRTPEQLYMEMTKNKHRGGKRHEFIAQAGADQLKREDKERSAVLSTVNTYLSLFRDPLVTNNTLRSDFRITDLMNAHQPVSLYIVIPGSDKVRLKPLVRLMITQIIRGLVDVPISFETVAQQHRRIFGLIRGSRTARMPTLPHKRRLLMMMDEFPSLGRLSVFEDALAKCAGYGIKAFIVMQDREQLLAAYHHETILSNCHVRIVYAPNKWETADWISKELGTTTVNVNVYSQSGKKGGFLSNVSHSISQVSRPLMTSDEVMRMPGPQKEGSRITQPGELIIITAGRNPIKGRQLLYFEDPTFAERAAIPPPDQTDTLAEPAFEIVP